MCRVGLQRTLVLALMFTVIATVGSCLRFEDQTCANDTICPSGSLCLEAHGCVPAEQVEACANRVEDDDCVANNQNGRCELGVCIPICGDGVLDERDQCEAGFALGETCVDHGFDIGTLGCDAGTCTISVTGCAHLGWTREPTALSPTIFSSVWVNHDADIFAIDYDGLIAHYDGAGWTAEDVGAPSSLFDVWGSGPDDVFVVGAERTFLHYDGARWSLTQVGPIATETVVSVWGSGRDDVFAVGDSGTIFHYDGHAWTVMTTLPPTTAFAAVWGNRGDDVYAIGTDHGDGQRAVLLRYDGAQWSELPSVGLDNATGLWTRSTGEIFVVGAGGAIARYDGQAWSSMESGVTADLMAIHGNESGEVFAAASDGTVLYYDGGGWLSAQPEQSDRLYDVWAGDGVAYVVGSVGFSTGGGMILRYGGASWTGMTADGSIDQASNFTAAWSNAADDVFAVGSVGGGGVIAHYDGAQWREHVRPAVALTDVWGSDASHAIAVGESRAFHYDGAHWSEVALPSPVSAVWGHGRQFAVAVGSGCAALRHDGATWHEFAPAGCAARFASVWGSGVGDIYAVGAEDDASANGAIYHHDGVAWSRVAIDLTGRRLLDVWGSGSRDVWAVGEGGLVVHYDGNTWTEMDAGTAFTMRDVWGSRAGDVFVSGDDLYIYHYNGDMWTPIRKPGSAPYQALCGSAQRVMFFGADGAVHALIRSEAVRGKVAQ